MGRRDGDKGQKYTAHRFTARRSVYIAQIYFATVGPHLSSIYICLEQKNVSYSLGRVMHKSKLQDLLQSSCRLDLVLLFQVLHMYVIWFNASIPLKRNGRPPYDAVSNSSL